MNKKAFRLSPGAPSLVLIVVVLCMSIMGMLMFIRTRNDMRLSSRSVQVAQADMLLANQAEATFARLDALVKACREKAADDAGLLALVEEALPEEMELWDRVITWQEESENRAFTAGVYLCSIDDDRRIVWHTRMMNAEVGETWNEF